MASDSQKPADSALHKLPSEIYLVIFEQCDGPRDILSLISADPFALSYYMAFRRHILRTCAEQLEAKLEDPDLDPNEYPNLASDCIAAIRLRALHRHQTGYYMTAYGEAARLIIQDAQRTQTRLPRSLSFLCKVSSLISEVDELISHYAPYEWSNFKAAALSRVCGRKVVASSVPDPLKVSSTERYLLYKAILLFENYCHAYFYNGQCQLDDRLVYDRMEFFRLSVHGDHTLRAKVDVTNFSNVLDYVSEMHRTIYHTAVQDLPGVVAAQSGKGPTDWRLKSKLSNCTPVQRMRYLGYIGSQGIQTLLKLLRMNASQRMSYTVNRFCQLWSHEQLNLPQTYRSCICLFQAHSCHWRHLASGDGRGIRASGLSYFYGVLLTLWDHSRVEELQLRLNSFANKISK